MDTLIVFMIITPVVAYVIHKQIKIFKNIKKTGNCSGACGSCNIACARPEKIKPNS